MKPISFLMLLVLGTLVLLQSDSHRAMSVPPSGPVQTVALPETAEGQGYCDPETQCFESVEGLPVPILHGTRVTRADDRTPRPRFTQPHQNPSARPDETSKRSIKLPPGARAIAGRLSATEDRARADARLWLNREVADWIEPEVARAWQVPPSQIDQMIVRTLIKAVPKDYGTVYEATIVADFSPERRATILAVYQRDLVAHRMMLLGGVLLFLLACLSSLAGYIRADEATRGYYTRWLRVAATAGVGASGVLIYQFLRGRS